MTTELPHLPAREPGAARWTGVVRDIGHRHIGRHARVHSAETRVEIGAGVNREGDAAALIVAGLSLVFAELLLRPVCRNFQCCGSCPGSCCAIKSVKTAVNNIKTNACTIPTSISMK